MAPTRRTPIRRKAVDLWRGCSPGEGAMPHYGSHGGPVVTVSLIDEEP